MLALFNVFRQMDNAHFMHALQLFAHAKKKNYPTRYGLLQSRSLEMITRISLCNVFDGLNIYIRDWQADALQPRLKVEPQMLNMVDKYGYTILPYAAQNDHTDIDRLILEMIADPNACVCGGDSIASRRYIHTCIHTYISFVPCYKTIYCVYVDFRSAYFLYCIHTLPFIFVNMKKFLIT